MNENVVNNEAKKVNFIENLVNADNMKEVGKTFALGAVSYLGSLAMGCAIIGLTNTISKVQANKAAKKAEVDNETTEETNEE